MIFTECVFCLDFHHPSLIDMPRMQKMFLDRFSPTLYYNLGIFLPLIAVNCSIFGGSLLIVERDYTLMESIVFGFGSGLGFFLAMVSMASTSSVSAD